MNGLISFVKKYLVFGLILVLALTAFFPQAVSAQYGGGTPTPNAATVQVVTDPKLGQILAGSNGMTLYRLSIDTAGVSKCTGACVAAWPPLTVSPGTQPVAGTGVTGKLGTFTRPDGPTQVTINGWPLYYFSGDKKPGDVNGQGINAFGGVWHAVKPDGTPNTGM